MVTRARIPKAKRDFVYETFGRAFELRQVDSMVAWAEECLNLPGSARSERFDASITPWTRAPLESVLDRYLRMGTFIKPVQSGGSVVGEAIICEWIANEQGGDIQYNWEDDEKADARFDKRFSRILRACPEVMKRWPAATDRTKVQKGLVLFPHLNLTMQGVFTDKRVASDSIRFQVNEEIHGWKPGRLGQAWARCTAYFDHKIYNISNASQKDDELDAAFKSGTQEHWEVLCPGCGKRHQMLTRWDPKRPDLGGLRYNSDGCKLPSGDYDYVRMASSVRYQMPCGYEMPEDASLRRQASLGGDYGERKNKGAAGHHRSWTLEAVSVDYIPWQRLIEEKHAALRALKYGNPEPWRKYLQERECKFWDPRDRPILGVITTTKGLRMNREGLIKHPDFFARLSALDYQQGKVSQGEVPHWWIVIRDTLKNADSRLVYEGRADTDENAISVLDDHKCLRHLAVADSGFNASRVYQFCLRYGINAIKGSDEQSFTHTVKLIEPVTGKEITKQVRRIWSPETPLYLMANTTRTQPHLHLEPQFWLYSKAAIRDRLALLRAGKFCKWEVPEDVSENYQSHLEAEELAEEIDKNGRIRMVWKQVKDRNDLFVCEGYIGMQMERGGLLGLLTLEDSTPAARNAGRGDEISTRE